MAIHHSPVLACLLSKTHSGPLTLPNLDPLAFYHIYLWMRKKELTILKVCTRANISTGTQIACTLLCRMFAAALHLDIVAIQLPILGELIASMATARDAGERTPILPGTVIEVWEIGDRDYVLRQLVLLELRDAFSRKPLPEYEEYERCFDMILSSIASGGGKWDGGVILAGRYPVGAACKALLGLLG